MAATGAMRLDGISTPVPSRIRVVFIAAAAIATKGSALSIWVSKNQALAKPSSSARRTRRQESAAVGNGDAELHVWLLQLTMTGQWVVINEGFPRFGRLPRSRIDASPTLCPVAVDDPVPCAKARPAAR